MTAPRVVLVAGALAGLITAIASITVRDGAPALPTDVVAVVNGTPLRGADFERALAAVASDRRTAAGPHERRAILDRLIEEELLVQRARELGLDASDPAVRARLVAAMVEAILADVDSTLPSAAEVAAFWRAERAALSPAARLWVRALRVDADHRTASPADRAREAVARLRAGDDFDTVARELAVAPVAPPPAGLVPAPKLREYLGPSLTARALALTPGEVTDPIADGSGYQVLQLVARDESNAPELATVETEVRTEMRRRADDRTLRAYLDRLRAGADVRTRDVDTAP